MLALTMVWLCLLLLHCLVQKMVCGWCIWVCPMGGAEEGEIDSLESFIYSLVFQTVCWMPRVLASYEARKPADKRYNVTVMMSDECSDGKKYTWEIHTDFILFFWNLTSLIDRGL